MAIPLNDPSKPSSSETQRARGFAAGRDVRRQYRVHKGNAAQLEATIMCPDGRHATGECIDLSVGGVGVSITHVKGFDVVEGTRVRLRVQYLGRPKFIEADAEIVTISNVGNAVRYGFRFAKVSEVVQQIDPFYARWFNRRRNARVMPDFTTKICATVRWSDGEFAANVHDISTGGLGILTPAKEALSLQPKSRVELSFTLPGNPMPVACRAKIVGMKSFTKNMLVGLEFEPNGGIERHASALQRYVDDRQHSIAKYNEAIAAQSKRAS